MTQKTKLFANMITLGLISTIVPALTSNVNAGEVGYRPYIGLSVESNSTNLKNSYYNDDDLFGSTDKSGFGLGLGLGLRVNIDKFYVGAEAFGTISSLISEKKSQYDQQGIAVIEDELILDSNYNARINVGYNFTDKFTLFGSIGLKHFRYESMYSNFFMALAGIDTPPRYTEDFIVPTFSVGVSYFVFKHWETKISYEYAQLSVTDNVLKGMNRSDKVDLKISTIKFGLNYVF